MVGNAAALRSEQQNVVAFEARVAKRGIARRAEQDDPPAYLPLETMPIVVAEDFGVRGIIHRRALERAVGEGETAR